MIRGIMYISDTTSHGYAQIDCTCSLNCLANLIENSHTSYRGFDNLEGVSDYDLGLAGAVGSSTSGSNASYGFVSEIHEYYPLNAHKLAQ
jgi:hypothetical protein